MRRPMETAISDVKSSLQRIAVGSFIYQGRIAKDFDMHPRDLEAISLLSLHGTSSAGDLGQKLGLTSGATTALIDRLVAGGFARRRTDRADRRKALVELGGPQLSRLRSRYKIIEHRIDEALSGLSASEVAVIADFLARLSFANPPAGEARQVTRLC